ncbi:MAG: MFS transporter [Bacilli bacterium]|nr:MFS transporter [Bacilli bacterium]
MEKLDLKTKLFFAVGGLGKDAMFAMSTIMMFYFNNLLGISAAFLGVMMMIVRVWDAINDPIMGTIVERTKSRWGKFRPWILIGSILNAIVLIVLFSNPNLVTNSVSQYIFISTVYTLWGMTYTLMDIPFWSMIPSLSSLQSDRESVTILTRLFTSIGFFIVSAGYLAFAKLLGGGDTSEAKVKGLFIFAIIVSIVFVVTQIITVTNVKEKIVVVNENKTTLREMFRILKENDQLLVVMIVVLVINFTLYITSGMAIYYMVYDIGNEDLFFSFMAAGGVLQVVGAVTYGLLSSRLKRKQIFNFAIAIQFVGFVLLFINAFIFDSNILLLFLFATFIFYGQGTFNVLQTVLLSDTVEYGELKIGVRSEAVAFSVQTFVVKLATGLSLGVIGVGLAVIQFIEPKEVNGVITEFTQSEGTLLGMKIMMFILPIFGLMLSRYIFNKKHIIDEPTYENIVKQLNEKRGEAGGEQQA